MAPAFIPPPRVSYRAEFVLLVALSTWRSAERLLDQEESRSRDYARGNRDRSAGLRNLSYRDGSFYVPAPDCAYRADCGVLNSGAVGGAQVPPTPGAAATGYLLKLR